MRCWARRSRAAATIFVSFLVFLSFLDPTPLADWNWNVFVANSIFLIVTAAVVVIGAFINRRLRRRAFDAALQRDLPGTEMAGEEEVAIAVEGGDLFSGEMHGGMSPCLWKWKQRAQRRGRPGRRAWSSQARRAATPSPVVKFQSAARGAATLYKIKARNRVDREDIERDLKPRA